MSEPYQFDVVPMPALLGGADGVAVQAAKHLPDSSEHTHMVYVCIPHLGMVPEARADYTAACGEETTFDILGQPCPECVELQGKIGVCWVCRRDGEDK